MTVKGHASVLFPCFGVRNRVQGGVVTLKWG